MKKDVIIIGAGAAGLMCAAEAGKRGRSVLVLEHSEKIAKKVRASGGGRCNFTNLLVHHEHYLSRNPHFCKSALARFTPGHFISLLEKHSIGYYEKEAGQLFCEKSSSAVVHMLEKECKAAGVEILLNCRIAEIKKKDGFMVSMSSGTAQSESLVVATGGLSYPDLGASGFGYHIARQFGLRVTSLQAGLVPLTLRADDAGLFRELSGNSLDALVNCNRRSFRGNILFTHRGLSGPPILQISSYRKNAEALSIDLLPERDAYEILKEKRNSHIALHNLLSAYLPRGFARIWCSRYAPSRPMVQYSERELKTIAQRLHHWEIVPEGTEGYGKAEVTVGGVDTDELSSKTMEAKKVPGLYFVGEVVDVTGQLGGYNLQWAWASGFVAGQYA
jgi:predicted Rossmann fold flavoprotein